MDLCAGFDCVNLPSPTTSDKASKCGSIFSPSIKPTYSCAFDVAQLRSAQIADATTPFLVVLHLSMRDIDSRIL
jgi:hypothetical protein